MSRGGVVTIEGAREVQRALKAIEGGISDLKGVYKEAADIVADDARPWSPVKTGRMKASIRTAGQAAGGIMRVGYRSMAYVPIQIFGNPHHNIEAKLFPYRARHEKEPEVIETVEDGIGKVVQKHGLSK